MSIYLYRGASYLAIHIHHDSLEEFKELVQRATNLWPDASPAIKEFADRVTQPEGRVLQDYRSQDTSKSQKSTSQSTEKGNRHES